MLYLNYPQILKQMLIKHRINKHFLIGFKIQRIAILLHSVTQMLLIFCCKNCQYQLFDTNRNSFDGHLFAFCTQCHWVKSLLKDHFYFRTFYESHLTMYVLCGPSMMDYPETSGNLRKPPETSGNLRKPPETSGNLRKPPETSGNRPRRFPAGFRIFLLIKKN
jgi:hypothetical protein